MKKKLLSLFLSMALVLSLCPAVFATVTTTTDVDLGDLGTAKVSTRGAELVYGNSDLPDSDAMVLLIMGDGFQASEQGAFYDAARDTAEYIMSCSPYDEFTDTIKIYALGVVSEDSGVTGANASSAEGVAADTKDTAFGAQFWAGGGNMKRLVDLSAEGAALGYALRDAYLPDVTDYCLYIVNSTEYGGSGGDYCTASLNAQSYDMMLHEMGHTIAGLADEYYAADYADEYANLTAYPDNVPWAKFVGKNGVGVYPWDGNAESGYYMPSLYCKMRNLSYIDETTGQIVKYDFCEVCKEALRKAICAKSNVAKAFFQPYAEDIFLGDDLSQYFILRKGDSEKTALNANLYCDIYYYSDDEGYINAPTTPGTYYVAAYVCDLDTYYTTYDYPWSGWYEYTVQAGDYKITLSASSKVYDGEPANVSYNVTPLTEDATNKYQSGEHFVSIDYYVTPYNNPSITYYYGDNGDGTYYVLSSADGYSNYVAYGVDAPSMAGEYEVGIAVVDAEGNYYASKSMNYTISLASTKIVDHNDDNYYGAYSYGNNKTLMIYGEGFTSEEQDKFDRLAKELTEGILAIEPFKETQLYFNSMSVNTVSNDSGIGTGDTAKDTFFSLTYDPATGKVLTDYAHCNWATSLATNMCYSYASTNESAACIIIVNDENVTGCSTYAPYVNSSTHHYYQTIYVTPNDAGWKEYAAAEVLNYLTWDGPGYRATTAEEKAAQRLDLLASMYCAYYNGFGPVIVSRAYDEIFVYTGLPVDLTNSFHVYNGAEEIFGVKLELTYYADNGGKPGAVLDGEPSQPGTYHVKAETVPDPEYANDPNDWGWQLYQPTSEDEELWIGLSRGWTTFTILPRTVIGGGSSSSSGSDNTGDSGSEVELPFVDVGADNVFADYVQYVYEHGIMIGNGDRFDTVTPLTRAQLVTTLYRMAGSPSVDDDDLSFTDSGKISNAEFVRAVKWAVSQGIIGGYEDGSFRPNIPVTRQAMMTILYRYANGSNFDTTVNSNDNLDRFQDGGEVSALMADAVNWAVDNGFVGGNAGNLNPTDSTTRGAAAKILAGFHQSYIA